LKNDITEGSMSGEEKCKEKDRKQ